jgi:hypothetical protein
MFRLHYCPDLFYFLTDRGTAAEGRALAASFGGDPILHFGPGEEGLLGDGWGSAEPEEDRFARWVVGRRAGVVLPLAVPGDRALHLDLLPMRYPRAPQQRVSLRLNDRPLGQIALSDDRRRYAIDAPRAAWRPGINPLTLEFDYAMAPADVDPLSSDRRPLAARVYELAVTPPGAASAPVRPLDAAHIIRIDEGGSYLDETSEWPDEGGRKLPREVGRAKLAQFVGRLGFDPLRAIPALASGRVTLANLAGSMATDSVCTNDEQFARTLHTALLGRNITEGELRHLRLELRRGVPRSTIVRRLANSDEVRAQLR